MSNGVITVRMDGTQIANPEQLVVLPSLKSMYEAIEGDEEFSAFPTFTSFQKYLDSIKEDQTELGKVCDLIVQSIEESSDGMDQMSSDAYNWSKISDVLPSVILKNPDYVGLRKEKK